MTVLIAGGEEKGMGTRVRTFTDMFVETRGKSKSYAPRYRLIVDALRYCVG
jgi:hypothetical protein